MDRGKQIHEKSRKSRDTFPLTLPFTTHKFSYIVIHYTDVIDTGSEPCEVWCWWCPHPSSYSYSWRRGRLTPLAGPPGRLPARRPPLQRAKRPPLQRENPPLLERYSPEIYKIFFLLLFFGGIFYFFFVLKSTLLHLPPLRIHCADGC